MVCRRGRSNRHLFQGKEFIEVGARDEFAQRWGRDGQVSTDLLDGTWRNVHWHNNLIRAHQCPDVIRASINGGTAIMMEVVKEEDLVVGRGNHEGDILISTSISNALSMGSTSKNIGELIQGGILGGEAKEGGFPRGDGR